MHRRSIVQAFLGLSVFSWLSSAKSAEASPLPAKPLKGLAARRAEVIDIFIKGLDSCIANEEAFCPQGIEPTMLNLDIQVLYPGQRQTVSAPRLVWGDLPEGPRFKANREFALGRSGRPLKIFKDTRMVFDGDLLYLPGEPPVRAPNFKNAIGRYVDKV